MSICAIGVIGAGGVRGADITFTADFIAADQPRVAWMLENPNPSPGNPQIIGPSEFFPYAILDTGANGVVLGAAAYFEFDFEEFEFGFDYDRYQRATRPGTGEFVQYEEIGVAGSQLLDVLAPYHLNIWGRNDLSDTVPLPATFALPNTNILGAVIRDSNGTAVSAADFGSFSAIIGMPAMVGRVVAIDLRHLGSADLELTVADFRTQLPTATANSLHVALTPLVLPPSPGSQHPDDPKPTFADVPLLTITAQHAVGGVTNSQTRPVLLDTGAQTSILSTTLVMNLGYDLDPDSPTSDIVDLNNDGQITFDDYLEVGGLGGTSLMPLVVIDRIRIPTLEGHDLVAEDVVVGVLDIGGEGEDALLDGVFGMNMLTTGYTELLFSGSGEYGLFTEIFFDFTEDGNWLMRLELNPDFVGGGSVPEPAGLSVVMLGAVGLLKRRRRSA